MQLSKEEKLKKYIKMREKGLNLVIIAVFIGALVTIKNCVKDVIEDVKINDFYKQQEIIKQDNQEEIIIDDKKIDLKLDKEKYIAMLSIPKINLEKGIYAKDSKNNNVNKNIQILNESDMPDTSNGNVILAGHSGLSRIAFFKDLNKLSIDDRVDILYNGKTFSYKVVNIYDIEKTGKAHIKRNQNKNTLTLITCRSKTNKQIVIISELINEK